MARRRSAMGLLERFARWATEWTGSSWAFAGAVLVIVAWVLTGPYFHYSDTWQLVINTGTTIVTFLMVFLIQHTQNADTAALHLKLDELIRATRLADNRLLDMEEMDEQALERLRCQYEALAERARKRRGGTLPAPK